MVDQWIFLLVSVWLGHRSMSNNAGAKVVTRFSPVSLKEGVSPLRRRSFLTRGRQRMPASYRAPGN